MSIEHVLARAGTLGVVAAILLSSVGSAGAATRYKHFASHHYRYRVDYPAGWHPITIPEGLDSVEVFTGPAVTSAKGPYRPSISIIVERAPAGMTLQRFVQTLIPTGKSVVHTHIDREVPTRVAGQTAVLLYGTISGAGAITTQFINAVFLARGHSWRITLATLRTREKADQAILMHMLTSLRLTG
jgi:hypothetical protein